MTALPAAQALLWKEARERALVFVIMLLLPLAAALCVTPFCELDIVFAAAIAAALLCALLIGATLTSDEDAAGGLAFERGLPVSALTIWLNRYGLGLAASTVIAYPTVAVVRCFGAQGWLHAEPIESPPPPGCSTQLEPTSPVPHEPTWPQSCSDSWVSRRSTESRRCGTTSVGRGHRGALPSISSCGRQDSCPWPVHWPSAHGLAAAS